MLISLQCRSRERTVSFPTDYWALSVLDPEHLVRISLWRDMTSVYNNFSYKIACYLLASFVPGIRDLGSWPKQYMRLVLEKFFNAQSRTWRLLQSFPKALSPWYKRWHLYDRSHHSFWMKCHYCYCGCSPWLSLQPHCFWRVWQVQLPIDRTCIKKWWLLGI